MSDEKYGVDLAGILDLNYQLTFTSGLNVLFQDIIGMLVDDHLFWDEDACYPLERILINNIVPNLGEISAGIEATISRDERVESVNASVESTGNEGDYIVKVFVQPSDEESFTMIGTISNFTIENFVKE